MALAATRIADLEVPKNDLREMSEEEFIELFEYLKERTRDFKEFSPHLILENNRYLLVLRLCLGLSQKEFALALGRTKDWARHTEASRNKILHLKIAERYVGGINELLSKIPITLEHSLVAWRRYQFSREQENLTEIKIRFKTITEMSEKDLKNYFEFISNETNNFTTFDPQLLVKAPQSVLIFRVVLGIDHRKFAKVLGIDSRTIRKYEHCETRMRTSIANKLMKIIEGLFKKTRSDVSFKKTLENFRTFTGLYGHRNLAAQMKSGLNFAKTRPLSKIEKEIVRLLESNGIVCYVNLEEAPQTDYCAEVHAVVDGLKRKLNVDFAVPSGKNPKVVIEATSFTSGVRRIANYRCLVGYLDHRFQMIKRKDPNVTTFMIIKFSGKPVFLRNVKECNCIGFT